MRDDSANNCWMDGDGEESTPSIIEPSHKAPVRARTYCQRRFCIGQQPERWARYMASVKLGQVVMSGDRRCERAALQRW